MRHGLDKRTSHFSFLWCPKQFSQCFTATVRLKQQQAKVSHITPHRADQLPEIFRNRTAENQFSFQNKTLCRFATSTVTQLWYLDVCTCRQCCCIYLYCQKGETKFFTAAGKRPKKGHRSAKWTWHHHPERTNCNMQPNKFTLEPESKSQERLNAAVNHLADPPGLKKNSMRNTDAECRNRIG